MFAATLPRRSQWRDRAGLSPASLFSPSRFWPFGLVAPGRVHLGPLPHSHGSVHRAGAPHAYGGALGLRRPPWKVSVADSEGQGDASCAGPAAGGNERQNRAVTVRERSEMYPAVTSKASGSGNCFANPLGHVQSPLARMCRRLGSRALGACGGRSKARAGPLPDGHGSVHNRFRSRRDLWVGSGGGLAVLEFGEPVLDDVDGARFGGFIPYWLHEKNSLSVVGNVILRLQAKAGQ